MSYDYAANVQIAGVSVAGGMSASSGIEYHRGAGRITAAADREYVYDARGRLASLQTKLNVTDATVTTYTYGDGNQLAEVDSVGVTWDAYGGMLQDHRGWGLIRGPDGGELALADLSNVVVYELVRDANTPEGQTAVVKAATGSR